MKANKFVALTIILSITAMPALCESNFSVTSPTPQTPAQYTTPQYTQIPYNNQSTSANQPLKGYVTVVPAGVNLPVTTVNAISSSTATLGQAVSVMLKDNFYYNNEIGRAHV